MPDPNIFEQRRREELDRWLSKSVEAEAAPGAKTAEAAQAQPSIPPAPTTPTTPAVPGNLLVYGLKAGVANLGGALDRLMRGVEGLVLPDLSGASREPFLVNKPAQAGVMETVGANIAGEATRKVDSVKDVALGLIQLVGSPISAGASTLREALKRKLPAIESAPVLANPTLTPFLRALMLEGPESVRGPTPEEVATLSRPFTVGDLVELGAALALAHGAAKGVEALKGKPGEPASPAAEKPSETPPTGAPAATPQPPPRGAPPMEGAAGAAAAAEAPAKPGAPVEPAGVPAETPPAAPVTPEAPLPGTAGPVTKVEPAGAAEATAFADRVATGTTPTVPPAGTEGPRVFGINWQRLGQEESVNRVVLDVNRQITESGAAATAARGVRSHDVTLEAAKNLGLTVERILDIQPGTAVNAETLTAMKGVRDVAARSLQQEAELAVAGDVGARADLPTLIALNREINLRVKGVTTEIARAQEAQKIPSALEASGTSMLEFQNFVERINGMADIDKAAEMITKLPRVDQKRGLVDNIAASARTGKDIVWELYVNSLLSGPKTVVKKTLGDGLRAMWELPERAIGRMNHVLFFPGDPTGIASGEARAMVRGWGEGLAQAVRMIGNEDANLSTALGETRPFPKAITAENLGVESPTLARIVDLGGEIVRLPGASLGAVTKLAKSASYQMELKAQAVRQASLEGLTGQKFIDRVAYVEDNPAEFPMIAEASKRAALANTFTQEMGPFGQRLQALLNTGHLRAQVPFLRVPWNISKFMVQSTPGFNVPSLLVGDLGDMIRRGGAEREMALAQVEMGAAIAGAIAYLVTTGQVTGNGPREPALRETRRAQGIPPYSLKIGEQWYRYHNLEPLGGEIGLVADFTEMFSQLPNEGEAFDRAMETAATVGLSLGRTLQSKPYFTGVKSLMDAFSERDFAAAARALAKDTASSLVPAGSLSRQFNQAYWDHTMREARTPLEAMKAMVPGWSDTLPPHRNAITGEPFEYAPGLGPDIASPISVVEQQHDPVFQELIDHQIKVRALPWSMAGAQPPTVQLQEPTGAEGVPLTPEQHDRWIVLMTQETKIAGRTLYDSLDHLMQSPRYQVLPIGPSSDARQFEVDLIMRAYREGARLRLLAEDPLLGAAVKAKQIEKLTNRLPVTNPRSTGTPAANLIESIGR